MVVQHFRKGSRVGRVVVLALAMALFVAGCGASSTGGSGGDSADRPVDRDATVKVAQPSLPQQYDSLNETVAETYFRVLNLVYDRLLTVDWQGEIQPMLATEWEYSDEGRTLTLTLREDATFDDGSPVDADVVVANLQRVTESESIVAAPLAAITKIEASEPYVVRIEMDEPTTQVLGALTLNAGMILHPDLFQGGKAVNSFNGSGPYEVTEFQPGTKLVLTRKDDAEGYWDSEAAQVKTFEVQQMSDSKALVNALKSGQIDVGQLVDASAADSLQGDVDSGKLGIEDSITSSWLTLSMNRDIKPLDDIEVRRAINEALDRDAIVEAFFPGSEPAVQWARKDSPYFDDALSYTYDPAAAKQRLADAGYPDGVDLGTVEVTTSASKSAAEALQGMLNEAGIKADLQIVDTSQVFANFAGGQVGVNFNWAAGLGVNAAVSVSRLADNFGPSRIQPGPTDEAMKILTEVDDNQLSTEQSAAKWAELNRYLTEQAWTAPVLWMDFKWAYDANLTGLAGGEYDYATVVGPYDWRYFAMHEE